MLLQYRVKNVCVKYYIIKVALRHRQAQVQPFPDYTHPVQIYTGRTPHNM